MSTTQISNLAVKITGSSSGLTKSLREGREQVQAFAGQIKGMGSRLTTGLLAAGGAVVAGIGAAESVKSFATFQSGLAEVQASANLTAAELAKVSDAAMRISERTGIGPTEIVTGMTELLKAGASIESVLGGSAESVAKFAKVSKMEVGAAVAAVNDAQNVFAQEQLSAARAADILSKAADASSISVEQVTQSFSAGASVAAANGQSMEGLAVAVALLGQNGIKGSDAGTALKAMIGSLAAPSSEAADVMESLGIEVRDASGKMKPMRDLIGELQDKLGGLDAASRSAALKALLGQDAIRAGNVFLAAGTKGYDEFTKKVRESLGVTDKYRIMNGGLAGGWNNSRAAVERLSITLGGLVDRPLTRFIGVAAQVIQKTVAWASANAESIKTVLRWAVAIGTGIAVAAVLVKVIGGITRAMRIMRAANLALIASQGPKGLAQLATVAVAMGAALVIEDKLRAAFDDVGDSVAGVTEEVKGLVEEAKKINGDATKGMADGAVEAAATMKLAIMEMERDLKDKVATFGMKDRQAAIFRLMEKGAKPEDLKRVIALGKQLDALEAEKKWAERMKSAEKPDQLERRFWDGWKPDEKLDPVVQAVQKVERGVGKVERAITRKVPVTVSIPR